MIPFNTILLLTGLTTIPQELYESASVDGASGWQQLTKITIPLFWTFITSLKTEKEIFQIPPTFYPHELNTKSYAAQIETGDFNMFQSFFNSFIISCTVKPALP